MYFSGSEGKIPAHPLIPEFPGSLFTSQVFLSIFPAHPGPSPHRTLPTRVFSHVTHTSRFFGEENERGSTEATAPPRSDGADADLGTPPTASDLGTPPTV
jgi:hypothetical protein